MRTRVIVLDDQFVANVRHLVLIGQRFLQAGLTSANNRLQEITISPAFLEHACMGLRVSFPYATRRQE